MAADPPKPKPTPGRTEETLEREAERRKRLGEALRANLRRRKAPGKDDGEDGSGAKP